MSHPQYYHAIDTTSPQAEIPLTIIVNSLSHNHNFSSEKQKRNVDCSNSGVQRETTLHTVTGKGAEEEHTLSKARSVNDDYREVVYEEIKGGRNNPKRPSRNVSLEVNSAYNIFTKVAISDHN